MGYPTSRDFSFRFARILPPCDLHSSQRLPLGNIFLFVTRFTLGEALHTSVIYDHFGALNFQAGRRLGHGANIAQGTYLSNAGVVAASLNAESHRRTGAIPLTTVIGRRLNLLKKEDGMVDDQCLRLRGLIDARQS